MSAATKLLAPKGVTFNVVRRNNIILFNIIKIDNTFNPPYNLLECIKVIEQFYERQKTFGGCYYIDEVLAAYKPQRHLFSALYVSLYDSSVIIIILDMLRR